MVKQISRRRQISPPYDPLQRTFKIECDFRIFQEVRQHFFWENIIRKVGFYDIGAKLSRHEPLDQSDTSALNSSDKRLRIPGTLDFAATQLLQGA